MLEASDIKALRKTSAGKKLDEVTLVRFAADARRYFDEFLSFTDDDFYEDDAFDYILEKMDPESESTDSAEMLDAMMELLTSDH